MKSAVGFYIAILILSFGFIRNKRIRFFIAIVGWVLTVIDVISYKFLRHHIDYFTLVRIDWSMFEMASSVVPKYFYGSIVVTILMIGLLLYLCEKTVLIRIRNKMVCGILFLLCITLLITSKTGIAYKDIVVATYKMYKYEVYTVENVLSQLNATKEYVRNENVFAVKGKNLIVIYCESLEKGFLNKNLFKNNNDNLNKLIECGWTSYSKYKGLPGSSWTVGALYATQTGLPTFFSGVQGKGHNWMEPGGNNIFGSVYKTDAVSWASVLKKAGYTNVFLSNSDLNFAGTGKIMSLFGYECKDYRDYTKDTVRTNWGVHDYDLFEQAKEEYLKLSRGDAPFNLTLLTVDTHFPKGIPDKRMSKFLSSDVEPESHEFTIATLDYLIGDFVKFIEKQDRETVIIIIGDHIMMGDERSTPIVKKLNNMERNILLLTNMVNENYDKNECIAFYNIPDLVLSLVNVKHNAYFGKEIFPEMSEKFILENKELFALLNSRLN